MRLALPIPATALLALLFCAGCRTPETVSVFCAASSTTLTEAAPVFRDLGASCLRTRNLASEIGSFTLVQSDPACDAVSHQTEGAVAAAALLSRYFDALNALAAVNTLKSGSDSAQLVSEASAAFGAGSPAQTALGSIAGFFTTAATHGYQQKSLTRDLTEVSGNVAAISDALTGILRENYLHQELGTEEEKLTIRYKDYAQQHPDGAILLHLDERWQAGHDRLEERRASAEALITSLGTIKAGVASLASNAHTLKAGQLPALLRPYTAQLQANIPEIQKAF